MTLRKTWIAGAATLALVAAYSGVSAQQAAPRQQQQQPAQQQRGQTEARPQGQTQPARPAQNQNQLDPQATEVVRRMSTYLGSLQSFSMKADTVTEVVLQNGQKIQTLAGSDVTVQRPNKLRSEREGPLADVTLVYDGDKFTLTGKQERYYAQTDAPNDLDAALDFARDDLKVEAPGADLLYTDVYEGLMRHAQSAQYLGQVEVNGVLCDHVAFRAGQADFQLWVQQGDQPLPLRYVITTTDQAARPEFIVELRDWNTSPRLGRNTFEGSPPRNAQQVDFETVLERAQSARAAGQERQPTRGRK